MAKKSSNKKQQTRKQQITNRKGNKKLSASAKSRKSNITAKAKVTATKEAYTSKLIFREVEETRADFWRKMFWGSSAFILVVTIVLALGSGINGDDYFQNDYADGVLDFYQTMGQDTSFFENPRGPIKIYGGLFEITTALSNKALGNEVNDHAYHDIRHFWNALFGFLAMLFTGLTAQKIGGWRAGVIALAFIFLSPRFLGHSLMNPKDIPFAAGYIMAIYFMLPFVQQLPKPNWKILLGLILGVAIAFGVRAGGVLLVAYMVLFFGLAFLLKYGLAGLGQAKAILPSLAYSLAAAIGGLVLGMLFWPYGLLDPIAHTQEAIGGFSKFAYGIRMLFDAEMIMGTEAPPEYLPTWMLKTVPLFSLLGLVLFAVFSKNIFNRHTPFFLFIALFTFFFPVLYVIARGSTLYDGWRHLIFAYPPLVVVAAIAWNNILHQFEQQKAVFYGALALMTISVLESAAFIVRNPQFPYVYFNPIAGGIQGAFGEYETDYWGVSVKQGLDWMEKEGIIGQNMTDTVVIMSNFSDALGKYVRKKYNGKVRSNYVRFRQRYDKEWDYGFFASRFVPSSYLKSGNWPPKSKTVHSIDANGVPILAILKNDDNKAYLGVQAAKKQDWATAIPLLEQEAQKYPDNEIAHTELARGYIQTNQLDQAFTAANNALAIEEENMQALNLLALYHLRKNELTQAEGVLYRSLEYDDRNAVAYYYLAIIAQNKNDLSNAINQALKAIEKNAKFKEAYQLAAQIYEKMGDAQNAQRYLQAYQSLGGR
ncbi:MAG: phospholipid carrier-dependent glycosyltransferase [Bacteroidota bacterium]